MITSEKMQYQTFYNNNKPQKQTFKNILAIKITVFIVFYCKLQILFYDQEN